MHTIDQLYNHNKAYLRYGHILEWNCCMFAGKQVINTTTATHHFKGSVLEPLSVTIILEFHVELQIRQKFV